MDANNNGVRDAGEIGLGGVTVQLYRDTNGNGVVDGGELVAATTTTAPDGSYLFTGVTASGTEDYIVSVDAAQAPLVGYTATTLTSRSYPDVSGGGAYLNADFGFRGTGVTTYTIQDRVWLDTQRGRALRERERDRRGHDGAAERQPAGDRHDHDGGGRDVHVQRPRGRRRRLHDPDHRHVGRPRQLLRYDLLRSGASTRREQPGREPGPHGRAQLRLPAPRAASATRSSTTSTATAFRTPATTGSPGSW